MCFRSKSPVKYTTAAVMARTILDKEVVKHIETCFTKKAMKRGPEERRIFQEMERVEKSRTAQREGEDNMRREKKERVLDKQAAAREREEKMRRAKNEFLLDRQRAAKPQSYQEREGAEKSLLDARQGELVEDVFELFTLRYSLDDGICSQERERVENLRNVRAMLKGRKVKVMLPKLDCTLKGRALLRYKQELGEILREQRRKLNMPVL